MITIKNGQQIEKMRAAGALIHNVLEALRAEIKPGITTAYLDRMAEELIRNAGAIPSSKGYEGFPNSICASVDEQVVHGFATNEKLRQGQLLSIDCTVLLDGWQSDSAFSVVVGGGDAQKQRLVDVTEECFWIGADMARAGNHIGDISHAVQKHAEAHGYGVVRDLCGHGIGTEMHEDPSVPNYGKPGRGVRLCEGMTIAIEPMISMGTWKVYIGENDWSVITRDHSVCSHYEHTIAVTKGDPEILTFPGASVMEALR